MHGESYLANDLMTREVVTVRPGMPVAALARLLAERSLSSVPVTDVGGRLLGIVTEADLLRRLAAPEDKQAGWLRRRFGDPDAQADQYARTHGRSAADVMTRDLVTVAPDATVEHCAHVMEEHRIKRLPVVERDRLVGIVSRTDLLKADLSPPGKIGTPSETRDERVRAALRRELREQPWADGLYTFADVRDGVVTLHGFVRSDAVRRGLKVLAGRIEGVEHVVDHLDAAPAILLGEIV